MALGTIATVLSAIGSAVGIRNGLRAGRDNQQSQTADEAAAAADPAASQRHFYQEWLREQFKNLTSFDPRQAEMDPEYQFQRQSGIDAIDRAASASGLLRSGTRMEDLTKFGQGLASDYVGKKFSRNMQLMGQLATLGGFTTGNPAAAGQIMMQGAGAEDRARETGWAQVGAGLQTIGRLWQQPSNYGTIDPTQAGSGYPY